MEFIAVLSVLLIVVCFTDWRKGLPITLIVGFLQGPIRKMMPDEPVYFVMMFAPFLAATILGALSQGYRISLKKFCIPYPPLILPMTLFVVLVGIQIIVAYVRTSSMTIAGIGGLAYFTPLVGVLFIHNYARAESDVVRLFQLYVIAAAGMAVGVYLWTWGFHWQILDSVGEGLYIYPASGGVYKLPSGFFRSPEVAAWHVTTAMCLLIILVVSKRWQLGIGLAVLLGLFLLGGAFLTGRRKMIIEILIFVSIYGSLLAHFRRGAVKLSGFLLTAGLLLFVVDNLLLPADQRSVFEPIVERSSTLFEDAFTRLKLMTVDSFRWVIYRHGFFGAGAGTASQGAQYFGGGTALVGGAAEGGVAKILTELGVIGLAVFLWLVISAASAMWRSVTTIARETDHSSLVTVSLGLCSFLLANFAVYVTASQIFGDPFVLFVLGTVVGIVFVVPILAAKQPGNVAVEDRRYRDTSLAIRQ